jgi:hypothetical protein
MKKVIVILLMGIIGVPSTSFAKSYDLEVMENLPGIPIKMPSLYNIGVYLDSETGYLAITPNNNITGLNITITGNGMTYLNTTVSLSTGQSYTDCLDYLSAGTYILTLSTADGVIDQYEITVEDD